MVRLSNVKLTDYERVTTIQRPTTALAVLDNFADVPRAATNCYQNADAAITSQQNYQKNINFLCDNTRTISYQQYGDSDVSYVAIKASVSQTYADYTWEAD